MKCVLIDARDRDPAARELLDDHRVGRQVEAHAAVLLGDRHPEQPELLHLLDDRLGEGVLVVVVLGVGQDLLVGELVHHLGDRPLLVGHVGVRGGGYGHSGSALQGRCPVHARLLQGEYRRELRSRRPRRRDPARTSRWSSSRATATRREWSFGEVAERCARLAGALRARGVGRGDVVMTLIGNRPEWVFGDAAPAFASARSCCRAPSSCARRTCACASSVGAAGADPRRRAQPRRARGAPDADSATVAARARRGAVRGRARAGGRARPTRTPA